MSGRNWEWETDPNEIMNPSGAVRGGSVWLEDDRPDYVREAIKRVTAFLDVWAKMRDKGDLIYGVNDEVLKASDLRLLLTQIDLLLSP